MLGSHPTTGSRVRHAALLFAAFAAPPLSVLAPLGLAPLVGFAGGLVLLGFLLDREWPPVSRSLSIILALVGTVGLLSCLWTIAPDQTVSRSLRLVIEIACGLGLIGAAARVQAEYRGRIAAGLLVGMTIALALLAVEAVTDGWLIRTLKPNKANPAFFNRGVVVLALLCWPTALMLWRDGRRRAAVALAVAVLWAVLTFESDSARVGLVVGGIGCLFFTVVRRAPARVMLPLLVPAMVAVGLTLPPPEQLVAIDTIKMSGVHRLIIWRFTADRIEERPLLGWGLEASRKLPGADRRYEIKRDATIGMAQALPLHPHNAILQIWVELGLAGIVLAIALLWRIGLAIDATAPSYRPIAAGMVGFALVIALLSFGIWQSWWIETLFLVTALSRIAFDAHATRPT